MAATASGCWLILNLFSLLFLFTVVTSSENTTNYNLNTTLFGDQNATYNDMDDYTTTQPAEFDYTTATPSDSSTEEPAQPTLPAEPLPVSGRLLTPVTNSNPSLYLTTLLNK